ncbi:synaptobrevin-like protein YKT6 [Enteropsectra breve]|nr:synaptobrevin-like protein YKT6 [Enteropsectra breve]
MPVYAIIKIDTIESRNIQEKFNLDKYSIFSRGSIKNIIRVMVHELSERANSGGMGTSMGMMEIHEKLNAIDEIKILTQKKGCIRVVVITDGEYDSSIAHKLLIEAFTDADYDRLIQDYRVWQDKDTMRQIEEELAKCKVTVVEGLSQILERGETLSDLVDKSKSLNMQTKILFKTAKKKNRCC